MWVETRVWGWAQFYIWQFMGPAEFAAVVRPVWYKRCRNNECKCAAWRHCYLTRLRPCPNTDKNSPFTLCFWDMWLHIYCFCRKWRQCGRTLDTCSNIAVPTEIPVLQVKGEVVWSIIACIKVATTETERCSKVWSLLTTCVPSTLKWSERSPVCLLLNAKNEFVQIIFNFSTIKKPFDDSAWN